MPDYSKGNREENSAATLLPALPPLTDSRIRRAVRFFAEHAGYSSPPGRMACAAALALAEWDARQAGVWFAWEDDPEGMPDGGLCSCGCGNEIHRCEGCVCYSPDDDGSHYFILTSLWGIWDASPEYRRVVQAELAQEAGYGR
jgi:hypothetical protein